MLRSNIDGSMSGGINQEGVDHYNRLIDKVVEIGKKRSILESIAFGFSTHPIALKILNFLCRPQTFCDTFAL